MFPRDIKWGHWLEMGRYNQVPNQCFLCDTIKPNLNIQNLVIDRVHADIKVTNNIKTNHLLRLLMIEFPKM